MSRNNVISISDSKFAIVVHRNPRFSVKVLKFERSDNVKGDIRPYHCPLRSETSCSSASGGNCDMATDFSESDFEQRNLIFRRLRDRFGCIFVRPRKDAIYFYFWSIWQSDPGRTSHVQGESNNFLRWHDRPLCRLTTVLLMRWSQLRSDFDSTAFRRAFDCLSKVIKVTVT